MSTINKYRIIYKVMEGNHYAGGWGKRTAYVNNLNDIGDFKKIVQITPLTVEEHESFTDAQIKRIIKSVAFANSQDDK